MRDYVHVTDLASAHIKALEFMIREDRSDVFNLGSGNGINYYLLLVIVLKR